MEDDKDMKNENDNENKIETVEYCWKTNRGELYSRLAEQINEKLNTAIQGLEYEGMVDPVVLYFSASTIARHFADQLESHGWVITWDQDDDVIQVDIVASIDQAARDIEAISKAHYFNQDDLIGLN